MIPIEPILSGDRLALSRLLTQIENQTPEGQDALSRLFVHTGRAYLIGITGAPGTGKTHRAYVWSYGTTQFDPLQAVSGDLDYYAVYGSVDDGFIPGEAYLIT